MRSAKSQEKKKWAGSWTTHVNTPKSCPFTSALHKKHFCTILIILCICQNRKIYPSVSNITVVISVTPCIWEKARFNLWHRLRLEEHIFTQMSGYIWQRKGSGSAPLHSCDFPQPIHFICYCQSQSLIIGQPPIKLGGKTRADGPHLMQSACIHPSIIMQFL